MDWYAILQIGELADDATIRKQYRKLALLLHPDKNKFAGAEAAFKLIGQANDVLSDPAKRSVYDRNSKASARTAASAAPKTAAPKTAAATKTAGNKTAAPKTAATKSAAKTTAATKSAAKKTTAAPKTAAPKTATAKTAAPKAATAKTAAAKTATAKTAAPKTAATKTEATKSAAPKTSSHYSNVNGNGFSAANFPYFFNSSFPGWNAHQQGEFQTFWTSCNYCNNRYNYFINVANATLQCQKCKNYFIARVCGYQSWGSFNLQKEVPVHFPPKAAMGSNGGKPPGGVHADTFKRSRTVPMQKCGTRVDGHCKDGFVPGSNFMDSQTSANVGRKRVRPSEPDSTECFKRGEAEDLKNADVRENDAKGEKVSGSGLDFTDFKDFEKDKGEDCFAVGQLWAIYESTDSMPRVYAIINEVASPFKLHITWLEPDPDNQAEVDWLDADLPIACGKFRSGGSQETADRAMFSHQMNRVKRTGKGSYLVCPSKGETWAIFRDWDIKWSSNPENHLKYEFDYVEILSDFTENVGTEVAYLDKVKGFVTLFQKTQKNVVSVFCVLPNELYRFSHRIPSYKMTCNEREGVPRGSFELDPLALPTSVF